jgi:hypothetical protein
MSDTDDQDPHAGLSFRCGGILTDDDGEELTEEVPTDARHPDHPGSRRIVEKPVRCETTLKYPDHYQRQVKGREAREAGYQNAAMRFVCPDCGNVAYRCPICSDGEGPSGWFRGESTGEQIPCHNCNQHEIQARRRHHGHAGKFGSRRGP